MGPKQKHVRLRLTKSASDALASLLQQREQTATQLMNDLLTQELYAISGKEKSIGRRNTE